MPLNPFAKTITMHSLMILTAMDQIISPLFTALIRSFKEHRVSQW